MKITTEILKKPRGLFCALHISVAEEGFEQKFGVSWTVPGHIAAEVANRLAVPAAQWTKFDYANKAATAPPAEQLVLIVEEFYVGGVTVGYFDGAIFRTWTGSDDCSVTYWAPLSFPAKPDGD